MKRYIVDTNVFLRFILGDVVSQQTRAEKFFKKSSESDIKLIVPQIVIFEIEFALTKYYGFDKEDIISKLDTILSATFLSIEDKKIFMNAFLIYKNHSISLPDAFLLSKSQEEQTEIFSFDKKLEKLYKSIRA
jgi:predicted nucleic-acid-binding protein